MKEENNVLKGVLYLFLIPCISIANGLVFCKLWEWFIVNKFGLPTLDIPHALGIALIVTYLTVNISERQSKPFWHTLGAAITKPVIVLFVGWTYSLFI